MSVGRALLDWLCALGNWKYFSRFFVCLFYTQNKSYSIYRNIVQPPAYKIMICQTMHHGQWCWFWRKIIPYAWIYSCRGNTFHCVYYYDFHLVQSWQQLVVSIQFTVMEFLSLFSSCDMYCVLSSQQSAFYFALVFIFLFVFVLHSVATQHTITHTKQETEV